MAESRVLEGNGGQMPALGFGTWRLSGGNGRRAIQCALQVGYRHLDTAEMYGNERDVGQALADSGLAREDVFLTTKVWHDHLDAGGVRRALEGSLQRLATHYVDLFLIHWPSSTGVPLAETLQAMAGLRQEGQARHVGVSNFNVRRLNEAVDVSPAPIFCNQVEYHPYLSQAPVLAVCREHGVLLIAYCPIARGRVMGDPVLRGIAAAHGKTPAQVAIRWHLQQGSVGAIPRSGSPDHIAQNFDVFDFELSPDEMESIFALQCGDRLLGGISGTEPDWDT